MSPIDVRRSDALPLCHGFTWTITDEQLLATLVAALLLGDHAHGRRLKEQLISGYKLREPSAAVDEIVARLVVAGDGSEEWKRWQRDGHLFQLISWVAACESASSSTLLRMPHVRPADKGLDGFMLVPPGNRQSRWSAVICEDKASERPRRTIRDEVWPEFRAFAAGLRRAEIKADAAALVGALGESERLRAIDDIIWTEGLRFRVCVVTDQQCDCEPVPARLFAGYDEVVPGDPLPRRRAETMPLTQACREWFDSFAVRVIEVLKAARE